MIEVLFDRLIDMAGIDTNHIFNWDGFSISLEEVSKYKNGGISGTNEAYGDAWKHKPKEEKNKEYHISRIIYFMEKPKEISGIEVDNPCVDNGILPGCVIIDGWHRIAAGILLNLDRVSIEYGGRSDVEDYIKGDIDERPDDILFF